MSVEVRFMSCSKTVLIVAGILIGGLVLIFGGKYLMTKLEKMQTTEVEALD